MKDVYHSFKSLAAAESEYRIFYEENSGSDRIVLKRTAAELSRE